MIGHHSRLRDVIGQSYVICASPVLVQIMCAVGMRNAMLRNHVDEVQGYNHLACINFPFLFQKVKEIKL